MVQIKLIKIKFKNNIRVHLSLIDLNSDYRLRDGKIQTTETLLNMIQLFKIWKDLEKFGLQANVTQTLSILMTL